MPPIRDEDALDDLLSTPTPLVVETLSRVEGDLVILGVGGKMGPTLARMARRALDQAGRKNRVIGVARFSQAGLEQRLRNWGIETVACDLLDPDAVARLPDASHVVSMTGMKFGASGQAARTWAVNCLTPIHACRRYRGAKMAAFSTGNVYGLTPVARGGSCEDDEPRPFGDYSLSALGRERMYEYGSATYDVPMTLLRLNYAVELRYGVLVDLAQKVWGGEAIDVTMGHFNAIWQGDANAMALASFAHVARPPRVLNIAGPEVLSVRRLAERLGALLDKSVAIGGQEADDAFLSDAGQSQRLFGYPTVSVEQMLEWVADWTRRDMPLLGKPTKFQVRDGKF
ncbi:MAG: NAD-dependent epimerase/dehydratase family protein [Gemmataceae bacterium]